MDSSLMSLLVNQLSGGAVGKISSELGIDESKTQQAVGMALPIILGALNRNASSSSGAEALTGALQRDHDGSILTDLVGAVTKPETASTGQAILGHVLGDTQPSLEKNVSKATGLDAQQISKIFAILAPVVLGGLGQMQRKNNLDAKGVSNLLQNERSSVEKTTSGLAQLLDMNGDGDVSDEIISLGSSLLGGLFGGKN